MSSKKDLVYDMCMLLGIGCGARPDNQYYGDGYFGMNLRDRIKRAGFDPKEIEAEARIEAKKHLLKQIERESYHFTKDVYEACETIDAAIFTGETGSDLKALEEIETYIQRWHRHIDKHKEALEGK